MEGMGQATRPPPLFSRQRFGKPIKKELTEAENEMKTGLGASSGPIFFMVFND